MADLDAEYRLVLKNEYEKRQIKNKKYSKNAYARFLGVNNTYLSKLLSGKILLSLDIADQITQKLKLNSEGRANFLLSAAEEQKCHALYLLDPTLTECPVDEVSAMPRSRS